MLSLAFVSFCVAIPVPDKIHVYKIISQGKFILILFIRYVDKIVTKNKEKMS